MALEIATTDDADATCHLIARWFVEYQTPLFRYLTRLLSSRLAIDNISDGESNLLIVDTSTWQVVKRLHLNLPIADYTLYMNGDGRRIHFATHEPNLEDRRLDPLNTIAEIDGDTGQLIKAHTFPKRQIEKLLRGP